MHLLREAELQVLASQAPLAEFQLSDQGKPVQDLEWITARAAAHDGVLKQALDLGPVIPFRFGTIARSAEDAGRLLARHHDVLVSLLESFRGKSEWGVKAERNVVSSTTTGSDSPRSP